MTGRFSQGPIRKSRAQGDFSGDVAWPIVEHWNAVPVEPGRILPLTGIGVQRVKVSGPDRELTTPASAELNIVSFVIGGENRHSMWHDGRLTTQGFVPSSTINIVPAGVAPRAVVRHEVDVLHLYVPQATLSATSYRVGGRGQAIELIDPRHARDDLIASLSTCFLDGDGYGPLDRLLVDQAGLMLTVHLLNHYSNFPKLRREARRGGLTSWHLKRVTDYIDAQLANDISLADLAALADLSESHFHRAFKASTGCSPHRWRLERRIERAREMLQHSPLAIDEIAQACGFAHQSHFTQAFRAITGATPAAWRRERLA